MPTSAEHHVALEVVGGVARPREQRLRRARRVDHHRSAREQAERGGVEDRVLDRALPGHQDGFLRPAPDSSPRDQRAEALAALLVVAELVEARAGGRQQHHLARLRGGLAQPPHRRRGRRSDGAARCRPGPARAAPPPRRSGRPPRQRAATALAQALEAAALEAAAEDHVHAAVERLDPAHGRGRRSWPLSRSRRARRPPSPPPRAGAARPANVRSAAATASSGTPDAIAAADGAHRVLEVVRAAQANLLRRQRQRSELDAPRRARHLDARAARPPPARASGSRTRAASPRGRPRSSRDGRGGPRSRSAAARCRGRTPPSPPPGSSTPRRRRSSPRPPRPRAPRAACPRSRPAPRAGPPRARSPRAAPSWWSCRWCR